MKKVLFIVLVAQCINLALVAQNKSKFKPSARLKSHYLVAPFEKNKEDFKLPFCAFEVSDVRYDSSMIGFFRHKYMASSYQYCFKNGLQQELQTWLNTFYQNNFDSNSTNRLLICIKKLWITDFDKSELQTNERKALFERLHFKAEIYYQVGNDYHPVQRIDSVFTRKRAGLYASWAYIAQALQYTVDQMRATDFAVITRKRSVDRQRLDSFYRSFALPVLKDTSYKKGAYATFADFKNNRPTYDSFELKPGKLSDILYVQDTDGKMYVNKDVWGFCDGTNLFVRMGLNFFPIYRKHQTWEFFGTNVIEDKTINGAPFRGLLPLAVILADEVSKGAMRETPMGLDKLRPFHIDMETGEIF